jgi:mono/diheme cytochrome c family protein
MTRWITRILGGIALLLFIAVAGVYVQSNRIINERHAFAPYPVNVPTDSASIAQGQRLARMRCFGCHGDSLQGRADFFDEPNVARIVTPNVPRKLASVSDAEFAAFLRTGVRKDGTSPFVMPPPGFYHVSDADLGSLIAYLRTVPATGPELPGNSYRLLGRLGVVLGQFKTSVYAFDTTQARVGQDPAWATTRHGEYLARVICSECHGLRLTGDPAAAGGGSPTPSLSGALAYSVEEFTNLLRTGTPREPGKQLGLMGETARRSLTWLTNEEIAAIYEYLKAMPPAGVIETR